MFIILIFILIGLNLLGFFLPEILNKNRGVILENGWMSKEGIQDGEYYRILSSMFLHADILHLASNLYGLFIFSNPIIFGNDILLYLGIYLSSGVAGNIFSFFLSQKPSLGASGAIFGLVGYYLVLSEFDLRLIFYVGISFLYAFSPGSRINWVSHLGGLLMGALIAFLYIFQALL